MPLDVAAPLLGRPVTISGLGTYLPETVVTNDDLSRVLDTSDDWIRQRTGIRQRRIAPPGMSSSDLGIPAAIAALADAGLRPEQVDLVITATISPDQIMPATASRIAYEAGCVNAGAFDVLTGCTGFVYGLAAAAGAVAAGLYDNVLVVGAEVISRIIDQSDRSTAILFGDGAGAALVSPLESSSRKSESEGGPRGILGFDVGNDGAGGCCLSVPAGGSRMPASHETVDKHLHFMRMNGAEVYRFATRVVAVSAGRVLERCRMKVGDIDLFVPHQANIRIIDSAAAKLGLSPEKVYTNLQRYGNTSCASIPLCLSEARAEGRLKSGDLALLMGFGAGLTWGACLIEWSDG
ncbi:MAG: ketoacyl-ACP synthase III [Actinobacteria bacterium]|nr:ketoacyl-ACP synthase III [Actinomycetota bacterium]